MALAIWLICIMLIRFRHTALHLVVIRGLRLFANCSGAIPARLVVSSVCEWSNDLAYAASHFLTNRSTTLAFGRDSAQSTVDCDNLRISIAKIEVDESLSSGAKSVFSFGQHLVGLSVCVWQPDKHDLHVSKSAHGPS